MESTKHKSIALSQQVITFMKYLRSERWQLFFQISFFAYLYTTIINTNKSHYDRPEFLNYIIRNRALTKFRTKISSTTDSVIKFIIMKHIRNKKQRWIIKMENLWLKMKKIKNLSKDLFGQIGSLKERNSLSSADPAIAIQIGSPKVRFKLIHWILPRHFLLISLRFFSDAFSI